MSCGRRYRTVLTIAAKFLTWSINDIDSIFLFLAIGERCFPITERGCALNCDALFPFQLHAIHLCANGIFSSDLIVPDDISFSYKGPKVESSTGNGTAHVTLEAMAIQRGRICQKDTNLMNIPNPSRVIKYPFC